MTNCEEAYKYYMDKAKLNDRHVSIELDLENLDVSPSEMEQCITSALSGSTMYDRVIRNVSVTVRKSTIGEK